MQEMQVTRDLVGKMNMKYMIFLMWYDGLDIKYKIFVPGNHDVSIENGQIRLSHYSTITPLIHEFIEIESIKIFGSPYTPEFCDWAYNVEYDNLFHYWDSIPFNIDILITHCPPLNIMDTVKGEYRCENVGDKYLFDAVYERNPQYHIFGHIHDNNGVKNNGIRTIRGVNTKFINASMVKDEEFSKGIVNKGITIKI